MGPQGFRRVFWRLSGNLYQHGGCDLIRGASLCCVEDDLLAKGQGIPVAPSGAGLSRCSWATEETAPETGRPTSLQVRALHGSRGSEHGTH